MTCSRHEIAEKLLDPKRDVVRCEWRQSKQKDNKYLILIRLQQNWTMISRNIHTKPICPISDTYKGLICRIMTCNFHSSLTVHSYARPLNVLTNRTTSLEVYCALINLLLCSQPVKKINVVCVRLILVYLRVRDVVRLVNTFNGLA
jgi:hypothetical protein